MENEFKHDSFEEYLAADALNSGKIVDMTRSPHHFDYSLNNPSETTPSMQTGKMIHEYILEPKIFQEKYAVMPDKSDYDELLVKSDDLKEELKKLGLKVSGTKEQLIQRLLDTDENYRGAIWDLIVADTTKGKKPISNSDLHMLLNINDAIQKHKHIRAILSKGDPEVSGYWFDEEFGMNCKMRADWITEAGYIVDLKTTQSGDLWSWQKKMVEFRYDIQAAWYCRGFEKIKGHKPKGFMHFLIETKAPFNVYLYNADATVLECGETGGKDTIGYKQAIGEYSKCLNDDSWPLPQMEVQNESMPDYFI